MDNMVRPRTSGRASWNEARTASRLDRMNHVCTASFFRMLFCIGRAYLATFTGLARAFFQSSSSDFNSSAVTPP